VTAADLKVVQGVPLSRSYRFVGAAATWPGAAGCEVKAQVKARPGSPVLLDLTPFLSAPAVVASGEGAGVDIAVVLSMTGADTRTVTLGGMYDLILSDLGTVDARAVKVSGSVSVEHTITDA
jgi:hypothetical protein